MSVVIRGMDMPKNCDECDLNYDAFRCILPIKDNEFFSNGHYLETNRLPNCPLVELPPHGRLIDADALNDMINRSYPMTDRVDVHNGYAICQEMIKQLPTIIEAEVSE